MNTFLFQYFESKLNKTCDKYKSVLENRILDLSNNFKLACIAGSWSLDEDVDIELSIHYLN